MMEPPVAAEAEVKPEQLEEAKFVFHGHHCGLCDAEMVHSIAQELLPGLASACVDNTTGGIFRTPGSIAVDMRKEMVEYLTQRSETFVAEFILAEDPPLEEVSEHPFEIITSLIDDFAGSKRNVFSRVSEWVLSDRRDDRIDDFVQEMEINGFWLLARRESVATMLLKNVDFKNEYHCNIICSSGEDLVDHRATCKFRTLNCTSEGCTTRYCAAQKENHEAVCPFMILPCEQKCPEHILRREMDRHCVTVCPMKLVNCAFYAVGCKSTVPRCQVEQHNVENLSSHLLCILRTAHKEASDEDLNSRVEKVLSQSDTEKLARARDARSLTYLIKDVEAKLGPLVVKPEPNIMESKEIYTIDEEESSESPSSEEGSKRGSPTKTESLSTEIPVVEDSLNEIEGHPRSPVESTTGTGSSIEEAAIRKEVPKSVESAITKEESSDLPVKAEESKEQKESSSSEEDDHRESPMNKEVSRESPVKTEESKESVAEEEQKESLTKETLEESSHADENESTKSSKREKFEEESSHADEDESTKSPKKEKFEESSHADEYESTKSPKKEKFEEESSNIVEEESMKSPKEEMTKESSSSDEGSKKSPKEEKTRESLSSDEEESRESPKEEKIKESSSSDEEESRESPKEEKTRESSSSDEEESRESPKEEKPRGSSSGDEQEQMKSPKREKLKSHQTAMKKGRRNHHQAKKASTTKSTN